MRGLAHFDVREHVVRCQHSRQRAGAVEPGQENNLKLSVKQYVPKTGARCPTDNGVTVIGAHANGFPKEVYEPLWDDLYEHLEAKGRRVRAIWIADMFNQGASGVRNETILGNDRASRFQQ